MVSSPPRQTTSVLLCRQGTASLALPLEPVREVMRPLPLEPIASAPAAVRGIAVVRGEAVPVVDLGLLVSGLPTVMHRRSRWVRLDLGTRRVILAVDAVVDVRRIEPGAIVDAPPLLGELGDSLGLRIGTRDQALLLLLGNTRIVPDALLAELAA